MSQISSSAESLHFLKLNEDLSSCPHQSPTEIKTHKVAFVIIIGFSGSAILGLGIAGYCQMGAFNNMAQIDALILIAMGNIGLIIFAIGLVKLNQIQKSVPIKEQNLESCSSESSYKISKPQNDTVIDTTLQNRSDEIETSTDDDLEISSQEESCHIPRFGKDMWQIYFGDIGEEPPLPENMQEILNSPCPFSNDESIKIKDTHFAPLLIPATINGEPFTLNKLLELLRAENGDFGHYDDKIKNEHGDRPIQHSYWVLMTEKVIPGTLNTPYHEQQKLVENYDYQVPSIMESAVHALMKPTSFTETQSPLIGTSCVETVNNDDRACVAGFGACKPIILKNKRGKGRKYCGAAGIRRLT